MQVHKGMEDKTDNKIPICQLEKKSDRFSKENRKLYDILQLIKI